MGYSNVAGDLNVYSTTITKSLSVRGDTILLGNITVSQGLSTFGNITVGNLVVTGNITTTSTNTTSSNSLSINNAGTDTALQVVQYDPSHVYNVAEFWEYRTLAMIIDPQGNVGIHTTSSPGYAFTVAQGASIDVLTLGTPLGVSSGGTGSVIVSTNHVFAGPSAGGSGPPSFRALVTNDMPSIISVSNVTANGAGLSSMNASNLSFGTLANSQLPSIISVSNVTANGAGLSSMNASNLSFGTLASSQLPSIISVSNVSANGAGLSSMNASNLSFGTVANGLLPASISVTSLIGTHYGVLAGTNTVSSSNLLVAPGLPASIIQGSNVAVFSNVSGNSNIMVMNSTGLVGIGTPSPAYALDIINTFNLSNSPFLRIGNSSGGSGNRVGIILNPYTGRTGGPSSQVIAIDDGGSSSHLTFWTAPTGTGSASVERMRILASGIVLIGTSTNATGTLQVNGVTATNGLLAKTAPTVNTTGGFVGYNRTGAVVAGSTAFLNQPSTNPGGWEFINYNSSNQIAGNCAFLTGTGGLTLGVYSNLYTAPAGGLICTGNVGIGVTNPAVALDVSGTVNATSLVGTHYGSLAGSNTLSASTANVGILNVWQISNLNSLSVSNVSANGAGLSSMNASNLSFGTVATGLLPSIISVSNVSANGAGLSSMNASNLSFGTLASSQLPSIISVSNVSANGAGLSSMNASNLSFGTVANDFLPSIISVSNVSANGAGLSTMNASNLSFGTVANGLLPASISVTSLIGTHYGVLAGSNTVSASTANVGTLNVWRISNLQTLNVISYANIATLNVSGSANLATMNAASINVANIFTTNIVGFVGSQWTSGPGALYYLSNVGIGTNTSSANLSVTGNVYVSNAIQTGNLILGGLTSGGFLQAQGTANIASVATIPIGSGGTNQTSYGTTNGLLYFDGTSFQSASGITASTPTTLNVATANITTLITSSVPSTAGLFMNLHGTYTLNSTGNWYGNVAGTWSPNLYTLFASNPVANWDAYGTSSTVNAPTVNGGITFNRVGPYIITAVISADNDLKTIALSSNTTDVHSNITNVWSYCYSFSVGTNPSPPVTIPLYVTSTSTYYYIDIETTNQNDNIHQTAYSNATIQTTGTYVIIRPV